jgi:uncharacterized protein
MKKTAYCGCIVLWVCVFFASAAWAANFPIQEDDYINDYANVIKPSDEKAIQGLLQNLRKQTGVEAVVVTVESLAKYAPRQAPGKEGAAIEAFATALFNEWGIGKRAANNGILVLFAQRDRQVRVELGSGYNSYYDSVMQGVVDESMIPYFKDEEYSRGLYEGVKGIIEKITQPVSWWKYYMWELIIGGVILVCVCAGISCMKSGRKGWGWAFFALAGTLIVSLVYIILSKDKSGGKGFGGGSSSGGGASGKW